MFRELRRKRQLLNDEVVEQILKENRTCVLSVMGEDGYPYGVPLTYFYFGDKIYMHSSISGHKIDAIKANDKVCVTIISKDELVANELTTYFESVIVFGKARIITDFDEMSVIMGHFGLHFYDDELAVNNEIEKEIDRMAVIEVTIDHITGKEAIELTRRRGQA